MCVSLDAAGNIAPFAAGLSLVVDLFAGATTACLCPASRFQFVDMYTSLTLPPFCRGFAGALPICTDGAPSPDPPHSIIGNLRFSVYHAGAAFSTGGVSPARVLGPAVVFHCHWNRVWVMVLGGAPHAPNLGFAYVSQVHIPISDDERSERGVHDAVLPWSAVHGKWQTRSALSGGLCAYAEVVGAIIAGAVAMPLYGGHAMYLDKALPWGELPDSFRILVACMCAHLAETLLPAMGENHRSTPEVSCPRTPAAALSGSSQRRDPQTAVLSSRC